LTGRKRAYPLGMGDVKSDARDRLKEWQLGVQEALTEIALGGVSVKVYLVVGILLRVVKRMLMKWKTATKKKPRLQRDGNPKKWQGLTISKIWPNG